MTSKQLTIKCLWSRGQLNLSLALATTTSRTTFGASGQKLKSPPFAVFLPILENLHLLLWFLLVFKETRFCLMMSLLRFWNAPGLRVHSAVHGFCMAVMLELRDIFSFCCAAYKRAFLQVLVNHILNIGWSVDRTHRWTFRIEWSHRVEISCARFGQGTYVSIRYKLTRNLQLSTNAQCLQLFAKQSILYRNRITYWRKCIVGHSWGERTLMRC